MKQVKITIVLNQPLLGEHTEQVTRAILGDRMAYGRYPSFSQERVTVEEIDTDEAEKTAADKAEELWPCKELSDKLARNEELTPKENALLFRNMDKQVAFWSGARFERGIKLPDMLPVAPRQVPRKDEEDGDELR